MAEFKQKQILALEAYYGGSHKAWLDGIMARSNHQWQALTLPPRKWKWRMRGAAIHLAEKIKKIDNPSQIDALVMTSMMNAAEFLALTRPAFDHVPLVLYMHENQYSYPRHKDERVDYHFALTNLISIMAADQVVFNSAYNRRDFFEGIKTILAKMPDCKPSPEEIDSLEAQSKVIAPGVNLSDLTKGGPISGGPPVVLWNHRWDRDKQPEVFAKAVLALHQRGVPFQLIVCGEQFRETPPAFEQIRATMPERLLHFGYASSREEYAKLLGQSDIVVSTAIQEFFGISVVEAVYAGAFPLLPNRLNYPNLIPEAHHRDCLYEEGELIEKLERLVALADKKQLPDLSEAMRCYDWDELIKDYDAMFAEKL